MCGISGAIGFKEEDAKRIVESINNSQIHRGPDGEGIFLNEKVCLGHRRLSIIDLSDLGKQPMKTPDGELIITYNGELYNFRELKEELNDFNFKTNTDTEVILAAYRRWGIDCLSHFNGMFAFAIYDVLEQKVLIARDRFGIKPLYFHWSEQQLIFASEIRPLLKTGVVPRKIDNSVLDDYMRYQTVHAPDTIIKNVKMLMPGTFLTYDLNSQNQKYETYWEPSKSNIDCGSLGYGEIKEKVKELFIDAVNKRLVSDVPLGAFLSGGIDSSAVVGTMAGMDSTEVKTFSIVFDDAEFTEAEYSRFIAKKFNTNHHELSLSVNDFLNELPGALSAMDHPSGDGPNSYVVSRLTKQAGITVAMSGLGGDELFAGYEVFPRLYSLRNKKWVWSNPALVRKAISVILTGLKPGIASQKKKELLLSNGDLSTIYSVTRKTLLEDQLSDILEFDKNESKVASIARKIQDGFNRSESHFLSLISNFEVQTYLQNVLLRDTDQMSMAHSLEVRVPFLDHELWEFVYNISDQYKFPTSPKKLLVEALGSEILPEKIVNREKMGFTFPWANWMQGELKEYCLERIDSLGNRIGFNQKGLYGLWNDFLAGDPAVSWSRVWMLVVLEDWLIRNEVE